MDDQLLDKKNGGFFDSPPNPDSPGYLKRPEKPLDDNSLAAMLLTKLYHATGNDVYLQTSEVHARGSGWDIRSTELLGQCMLRRLTSFSTIQHGSQ